MKSNPLFGRRCLAVGAFGALLLMGLGGARAEAPAPSSGGGAESGESAAVAHDSHACNTAFRTAQQRVQSARFVEASQFFLKCAKEACGEELALQCSQRNNDLLTELPSVVFVVTDRSGDPVTDVQVTMDGAPLTSRLDGLSLPVEAGSHEFAFSSSIGGTFASQKLVIVKGQRNRAISVVRPTIENSAGRRNTSGAPATTTAG